MLKNYLIVALRTLRRQKGYAAINLLGLATGVACCLFLLLYVNDELSYDRFHENADDIYRVNLSWTGTETVALTPTIVSPLLKREIAEVEATTRIEAGGASVRLGEDTFSERRFYFADSTVFDVLTIPMLNGDPRKALVRPNTVVLTQTVADRYFGSDDPIGQVLRVNNNSDYEITGVIADMPSNSHIQFDFLASFASRQRWANTEIWNSANFYTFVRLRNGVSEQAAEKKIDDLVERYQSAGEEAGNLELQPITSIHLGSGVEYELDSTGEMSYVIGFATLALLILLMACINYMNLATARSTLRAKEVGLRKSLGAFRGQLAGQFYGEAILLTFGALIIAVGVVIVGMPWFNSISGKQFSIVELSAPPIILMVVCIFAIVSLVAGSYPALVLSALSPVSSLRGQLSAGLRGVRIRQGLVVVQFAISAFLIVGTFVIVNQVRYMQSQNHGFDKEHILAVELDDPALLESFQTIRNLIAESPAVVSVSGVTQIPGDLGWTDRVQVPGLAEEDVFSIKGMPVESEIVDALGLEILAGRGFGSTPAFPDSTTHQFLLNETAAKRLGWTPEEALGQRLISPRRGEVIGIVADFNINSLHVAIEPVAIWYQPNFIQHAVVRINPGQEAEALRHIETVWADFAGEIPFSYRFLDSVYDQLYASENQTRNVLSVFAILAIAIACLGLLGLASFTVEKRTKEIGVRKALGASVPNIVGLLSKDFLVLVGIAFLASAPLTWIGLTKWLGGFAYRITLGPGIFGVAALVVLAIALATVSTQAVRAALADPVKSLRYD